MAAEAVILGDALPPPKSRAASLWSFLADPKAAVGVSILSLLILMALFADVIAPYDFAEQNFDESLVDPSSDHLLGTDRLGRDVFSRIIHGSRISLRIGFISVGIAALVGLPLGILAGYYRGWIDEVLMRFTDAMIAFPNLIFLLGVVAVLGPGVENVMIALGLNSFVRGIITPPPLRLLPGRAAAVYPSETGTRPL